MESARKRAATLGDSDVLRNLYEPTYAFLKQGHVRHLWDDVLLYDKDTIQDFTIWRNKVSVEMIPHDAKNVLEVGIGMGYALSFLSSNRPDVQLYGIDVSEEAVLRASKAFKGKFATVEMGSLPWNEIKFDAILMLEVLEHVEAPKTFPVLEWLHGLLRHNGSLIVSVPLETVQGLRRSYFLCPHCGEYVHQIGHVRSYSELEPIQQELLMTGFRIEERLGLAGGSYLGVPRQWLMPLFPHKIKPMVMIFRCRRKD